MFNVACASVTVTGVSSSLSLFLIFLWQFGMTFSKCGDKSTSVPSLHLIIWMGRSPATPPPPRLSFRPCQCNYCGHTIRCKTQQHNLTFLCIACYVVVLSFYAIIKMWIIQGTYTVFWRLHLIDWQPPQFTVDDNPSAFHPNFLVRFVIRLQLL